ncbi:MAG: hypothetical protein ACD_9C00289G0006 [uncultured bacterium]|nr:MAG: hypothetical protein ACD_9C00289G0006 [uncultured bacterium]
MEKIIIEKQGAGLRVDKFLAKEFFLYSRAEIVRRIKDGQVLINGKSEKPSYTLEEDDELVLKGFSREPVENILFENREIALEILFENNNIIVISKPAGLQVHPSSNEKENTLVNALICKYPEIKNIHDEKEDAWTRPGIVHRLDKDTSGVMVIARNIATLEKLKELFKNRNIEKTYLAITSGIFKEKIGIIDKPIARSTSYKKQVIARNNTKTTIRSAETHFRVLKEFNEYSLVEVSPKTGRMHQIRIHLSFIGHPVVGDLIYGISQGVKEEVERQLLHAHKLKFELDGEKFEFVSPEPNDFKEFLKSKE